MALPRIAIVHDWLTNLGGAERTVRSLMDAFPEADLYTSVYSSRHLKLFEADKVHTTFLQYWPLAHRKHQLYPVLRRLAFESLDLSAYDVVISSSGAEAKGVITGEDTQHISYIHTPTRYYWSHYQQYLDAPGFGALNPLVSWQLRRSLPRARRWDYAAAQRPDVLIANSGAVQERISTYYSRSSLVIHPPVDTMRMHIKTTRPLNIPERYLVVVSRLIPYKRVDIAVHAAQKAGWPLVVIGSGSQLSNLQQIAGPTTFFLGQLSDEEVVRYLQHATAMLFPGEEDFGITPVEAMAAGTPVIAYGKGGAMDTVKPDVSGIIVERQTINAFKKAIELLEKIDFKTQAIQKHAEGFSEQVFQASMKRVVSDSLSDKALAG